MAEAKRNKESEFQYGIVTLENYSWNKLYILSKVNK